MPEIEPFAAVRYNPESVALSAVVVPPYDVIKETERQRLASEAYSAVQLTLGPGLPDDTPESNRYTRSRDLFDAWQRDGVLVQEDRECLYVLTQEFRWDGRRYTRTHLVCSCRLHEWADRVILPHEEIMQGPKDDRQRLIETTRANYEPLFALAMGSSGEFRGLLRSAQDGEPLMDVEIVTGERNRVWRVDDPATIREFALALRDSRLVIADGHHRYTASLGVMRSLDESVGSGPWDYAMMTISAMDDPDLLILPTHRILTGLPQFDMGSFVEKLDELFVIEEKESVDELVAAMENADGVAIGLLAGEHGNHLLTPWRGAEVGSLIPGEHSDEWKRLDVSVLHGIIMDRILGLGAGESPHICYTRDMTEAVEAVNTGVSPLAFLLKSTPKSAVETIATNGETMPQKSTFFYPKLLTGLLMRRW